MRKQNCSGVLRTARLSLLLFSATLMLSLYIGQCSESCAYAPYSYISSIPLSLLALMSFLILAILEVFSLYRMQLPVLASIVLYGYYIGSRAFAEYSFLCPYCELSKISALVALLLNPHIFGRLIG